MACSGKRNAIYLMGDIVFNEKYERFIHEYSGYFDRVIWVLGNHDHLSVAKRCMMLENVYCVGIQKRFACWLTHAPVHPDELRGKFNVHGHVHTATLPDARYLNVSCENVGYKPIELHKIRNIFRQRRESGIIV
jgi:calcineurin-like phosphoesterase family protein